MGPSRFRFNVPATILFVCVFVLWQLVTMQHGEGGLPTAVQIAGAFAAKMPVMLAEIVHTLTRAAAGLALAIAVMIPAGVIMGRVPLIGALCEPIVNLLRPLPPPAIIPIAMIFAGTGDVAKIAVIFYGAAFPILLNTIDAVRGAHPMLNDTARSLRLTPLESMALIDAPAALPQIMSGIQTSVAISILISVTAEMLLSTDGIGVFVLRSQERFQITNELAGIAFIGLVSWIVNQAYLRSDRRLLRWNHATTGDRE